MTTIGCSGRGGGADCARGACPARCACASAAYVARTERSARTYAYNRSTDPTHSFNTNTTHSAPLTTLAKIEGKNQQFVMFSLLPAATN